MKFINILVAYFFYFTAPKKLILNSLNGTLLQLGVRLPSEICIEISDNIYYMYKKNKQMDRKIKKGGVTANMDYMWCMIQSEAFYIRDLLEPSFIRVINDGHEKTIAILKKYNIEPPNLRE